MGKERLIKTAAIAAMSLELASCSISPPHAPLPALEQPAPGSELGVFFLEAGNIERQLAQTSQSVIKVFEPQNNPDMQKLMAEYNAVNPKGSIIGRIYCSPDFRRYTPEANHDPAIAADDYWKNVLQPAVLKIPPAQRKLLTHLEGTNEADVIPRGDDAPAWVAAFHTQLAEQMAAINVRPVINLYHFSAQDMGYLTELFSTLRKAKGWISYHEYTNDAKVDASGRPVALNYQSFQKAIANAGGGDIPVFLGELGFAAALPVDEKYPHTGGWQRHIAAGQYLQWLEGMKKEMENDPAIIGGTIFQAGSKGKEQYHWTSFDISPIAGGLKKLFSTKNRLGSQAFSGQKAEVPIAVLPGRQTVKLGTKHPVYAENIVSNPESTYVPRVIKTPTGSQYTT